MHGDMDNQAVISPNPDCGKILWSNREGNEYGRINGVTKRIIRNVKSSLFIRGGQTAFYIMAA